MKKIDFGIRNKVLLGSVVIGLILFLSGVVAFLEYSRMSKAVSSLIANNIYSVNSARILINVCDKYNQDIFQDITNNITFSTSKNIDNEKFDIIFEELIAHHTTDNERNMSDSVMYAYAAYMQVANEIDNMWIEADSVRRDWYFNRLQPVYNKLSDYLQKLSQISQGALTGNYDSLTDSYYRAVMPGVVAVGAGILLVILFNYFINLFILKPIVKMNIGLRNYKEFGKSYDVSFDYGGDQIQGMNEMIKELVEENKSLKKR